MKLFLTSVAYFALISGILCPNTTLFAQTETASTSDIEKDSPSDEETASTSDTETDSTSGTKKTKEEPIERELTEKEKKDAANAKKAKEAEKASWELYSSDSTIFNLRFPKEYKYKLYSLFLNDSSSAFSEEVVGTTESDMQPENRKNLLVQLDQTFGSPLTINKMKVFLNDEAKKYEKFAKDNNGMLVTNDDLQHLGFLGKDLYLTYTDRLIDEKNKLALRVRILYTDTAKIQMVVSGNTSGMYSFNTNNFMESIRLSDGYGPGLKLKTTNWTHLTDPNNIFTLVIPPKHPSYRPDSPRYKLSKRISSAHVIFYDPVANQKMFYNVYAYKIGAPVNKKMVRKLLFSQHIGKFVNGAPEDSLKLTFNEKNGYTEASTQLVIEPKKEIPYVDAILLRAAYKDQTIVVQEMSGTQGHAFGDLSNTIMENMEFHPEKTVETSVADILEKNKKYKASKNSTQKSEGEPSTSAPEPTQPTQTEGSNKPKINLQTAPVSETETEPKTEQMQSATKE